VEVVGVILNKILPAKYELVRDFARRGLERLGIDLLGCIPEEPVLANATLGQICKTIKGSFMNAPQRSRRRVKKVIIGAMNSSHVMESFAPGTLVITPGDREDVILAALSTAALSELDGQSLAGLVLAGDLTPSAPVLELLKNSDLPIIASKMDSYTVASSIYSMTVKTLPGDVEKIDKIQTMVETHVEVDRLMAKLQTEEE
jgi:BioD-like phosphotransacetylase family protein